MNESKIFISVDSFKRASDHQGIDALKSVLELQEADELVTGLHLPAQVLEDFHYIDELWEMYNERNKHSVIHKLNLLGDISLSGSTDASCEQLNNIRRQIHGEPISIVMNHGLSNIAIESVIKRSTELNNFSFMLTGVLPEDFTDDTNVDNLEKSYGFNPEHFTEHTINRVHSINDHLGYVGIIGIYGSARFANIERGYLSYTGVGISYDGEPYISEGVAKHSTSLEVAMHNCDAISVGNIFAGHPDGPVIGFKELASRYKATV